MDKIGEEFKIEKGVRQRDPISPNLFNSVLEDILRKMDWEGKGIRVDGEYLSNQRFADDVVIIVKSLKKLKQIGEEFLTRSKETGLIINETKSKFMSNKRKEELKLGGVVIESVEEIEYLSQMISFKNRCEQEMNKKIQKEWRNFWTLRTIYKGKFTMKMKTKIWESCTQALLVYGAQTWTCTKTNIKKNAKNKE